MQALASQTIASHCFIIWILFILAPIFVILSSVVIVSMKSLKSIIKNNVPKEQGWLDISWTIPFENDSSIHTKDVLLTAILLACLCTLVAMLTFATKYFAIKRMRLQKKMEQKLKLD